MRTIFFLILILTIKILSGQNDSIKIYKNQIKFSPARIVTGLRGIQFSYERKFSQRFSTQLTAAYLVDLLPPRYSNISDLKGFLIGVEQKYFPGKNHKANRKKYLAADFTFLNSWFRYADAFTYPHEDSGFVYEYQDTINVNRKTYTFSLKYGFQFTIKHFILDLNLGLGIRYRDVTHTDKLHPDAEIWKRLEPNAAYELFRSGQYFSFAIPFGLKLGYVF